VRFILVDEISELDPGKRVRAIKRVAFDEDYFSDHFPGFPVVPGVLLTEMMGQAAAKCLLAEDPNRGRPMLAQIKSASFRDWVRPGQTVTLVAEVKVSRPQFATAFCQALVGDKPVSSAELLFSFIANDQFAPGSHDEVLETFLARQSDHGSATENAPEKEK